MSNSLTLRPSLNAQLPHPSHTPFKGTQYLSLPLVGSPRLNTTIGQLIWRLSIVSWRKVPCMERTRTYWKEASIYDYSLVDWKGTYLLFWGVATDLYSWRLREFSRRLFNFCFPVNYHNLQRDKIATFNMQNNLTLREYLHNSMKCGTLLASETTAWKSTISGKAHGKTSSVTSGRISWTRRSRVWKKLWRPPRSSRSRDLLWLGSGKVSPASAKTAQWLEVWLRHLKRWEKLTTKGLDVANEGNRTGIQINLGFPSPSHPRRRTRHAQITARRKPLPVQSWARTRSDVKPRGSALFAAERATSWGIAPRGIGWHLPHKYPFWKLL